MEHPSLEGLVRKWSDRGTMKVLDLFSGIGGFSLGLERAGMETVAFCEIDPFCRKVLNKHWPDIPIHEDIRTLDGEQYRGTVDVVCGGFPCQDISSAGTGAGIDGTRSGLWSDYARIIREVRPRYALIENSDELVSRGLQRVLSDLAQAGYDAEWQPISACSVGASHARERLWIVAYPNGLYGEAGFWYSVAQKGWEIWPGDSCTLSYIGAPLGLEDASALYGGADDVPHRVDRLRALGNAVVPAIPEILGRAIMEQI